jgi:hypothetical protein
MIKHTQIFLLMIFIVAQAQASLLSDAEMYDFMDAHRDEIENALPGANAHKGYRVIAVAYEKMQNNPFEDHLKPKVASHYANVVLSALRGVGFGGLSSKAASAHEIETACHALYAIGYNLTHTFSFETIGTPEEQTHYDYCNAVLSFAKKRSPSSSPFQPNSTEAILIEKYKKNFSTGYPISLNEGEAHFNGYRLAYENALEQLKKKARMADERMFKRAVGAREYFGKPSFNDTSFSKTSTPSPLPEKKEIPEEAWSGILYRNKQAAEKAIERGKGDEVCQATGNLIVRVFGKSIVYSSTATLILQNSGTTMAVTNAHCVSGKDEETISSVELQLLDGDTVYFDQIFIHPKYCKNGFDVALLKGKHGKSRNLVPIYPGPIDSTMLNGNGYLVSYAKVNYMEGQRIITLNECARTLSIRKIERVGPAPLYQVETERIIQAPPTSVSKSIDFDSLGSKSVTFSQTSHELDPVCSYGCSGSPFYIKVKDILYLAGLHDSSIYTVNKLGFPIRINVESSIYAYQEWINEILMGQRQANYRTSGAK